MPCLDRSLATAPLAARVIVFLEVREMKWIGMSMDEKGKVKRIREVPLAIGWIYVQDAIRVSPCSCNPAILRTHMVGKFEIHYGWMQLLSTQGPCWQIMSWSRMCCLFHVSAHYFDGVEIIIIIIIMIIIYIYIYTYILTYWYHESLIRKVVYNWK